jgi:hypothetical protein
MGNDIFIGSLTAEGVTLSAGTLSVGPAGGIVTADSLAVYASYVTGGSVDNQGLLASTEFDEAVLLRGREWLSNAGTIKGITGLAGYGGASISNAGSIIGTAIDGPDRAILHEPGVDAAAIRALGPFGEGVGLNDASLTNGGSIYGVVGGVDAVSLSNVLNMAGARIAGIDAGLYVNDATLTNLGSIYGARLGIYAASGAVISNAAGGVIAAGAGAYAIAAYGDVSISNAGTILGGITAAGGLSLTVAAGAEFTGIVEDALGTGRLVLGEGGGSFALTDSFSGFSRLDFAGAGWTLEGDAAALGAGLAIDGFVGGDTIELDGFTAASTNIVTSGLVLTDAGGNMVTLAVTGDLFGVKVTANAAGTELVAPCFVAGTRITTGCGPRPVETLRIGDEVATLDGGMLAIKWIGTRAYEGRFAAKNFLTRPVRIATGAIADGVPVRDLYVSPDHAICLDGHLIHAWRLVNGVSVTQPEPPQRVDYFHIELERHAVIFAENCPAESFLDEDCRGRFQNAAEFYTLYPEAAVAREACLPRWAVGFGLHAIWERLAERAGVAVGLACGPLRGCVDEVASGLVRGWAQDVSAPEAPVALLVLAGGEVIGRVLANGYRPDLRAALLGSGCHGFAMAIPAGEGRVIEVRRALDGAVVGGAMRAAA